MWALQKVFKGISAKELSKKNSFSKEFSFFQMNSAPFSEVFATEIIFYPYFNFFVVL